MRPPTRSLQSLLNKGEQMETARSPNFTGLARLEWYELIFFSFPTLLVLTITALIKVGPGFAVVSFINYSISSLGSAIIYFISGCTVSYIIDKWRCWSSKAVPQALPYEKRRQLNQVLTEIFKDGCGIRAESILWCPQDLLMGAHVRGIIQPQIVVSGGLFLGILRKNPRAIGILAHEIAHIEHYDRLLPGLIGMMFFEIFLGPIYYYWGAARVLDDSYLFETTLILFIYKFFVFGGLLCLMSRSREIYADASAAQYLTRDEYVTLLKSMRGAEKYQYSFFHPSVSKRIKEAQSGFATLHNRWLWRAYFVAATAVSWLQLWQMSISGVTDVGYEYIYSASCMGTAILVLEGFRGPLMRSRVRFGVPMPSLPRPVIRFLLLIGGVGCAAYVSAEFGQTVGLIVGGVAYAIFSALKDWSKARRV